MEFQHKITIALAIKNIKTEPSMKDFIEEESNPKFKFKEDKSIPNGSSIAFILQVQNKKLLSIKTDYETNNHLPCPTKNYVV